MRQTMLPIIALSLVGCSPQVMLAVDVDEPVNNVRLELNGNSYEMKRNVEGIYLADWGGGDASGHITVQFPDREEVQCDVGYITGGMEPQRFEVSNRRCNPID